MYCSIKKPAHIIAISVIAILSTACLVAQPAYPDHVSRMSYIENEFIKVGIDLTLGGAITYLADKQKEENLINNSDWGRQVQMSFYSGPVPFEPNGKKPNKAWTFIGWNPIQSGDVAGNKSQVLDHKNTGKTLYVKCIPMHWPLDNVPGECTYECWISLDGPAVKITSRIVNNRPDKTQYPARGQELPAVYTNAPWHRLITYQGNKPFTNDTLSQIKNFNPVTTKSIQWAHWQATECWAANVNEHNYGLGVWNAGVQQFSGGYYGDSLFVGGSYDAPTAYIAPNSLDILDYNITYDYNYALILGTIEEIRRYVYKHSRHALPEYHFNSSRWQWYYKNTTDAGWPVKDGLLIQLKKGATMIGPVTFWKAADAPVLKFTASYPKGVTRAKVWWKLFRGDFEEKQSMEFDVTGDGKMHTYKVPLHVSPEYKDVVAGLKILLNAGAEVDEAATVRVRSVSLK